MSLKILHLPLILFLIIAFSCVVSCQDSKPNLIIGGIWQNAASEETNQKYADILNAEYVHTYNKGYPVADLNAVDIATPTYRAPFKNPFTGEITNNIIPLKENPANSPGNEGHVVRSIRDPSTGAIVSVARYTATELNGLTDDRLNPSEDGVGDHYGTIYAHSGGARTAVTALLYQGVTADKLVLTSPAKGDLDDERYKWEIQRLLDLGIVKEIVVYQSDADTPFAENFWKGEFKEGDVQGNFKIIPVSKEELLGKTGNDAHKFMWEAALSKENEAIKDLAYNYKPTPIPKSLLKKEFLQSFMTPMLSPTSDASGFCSAQNVPESSGVSYFDQANDVWYIDAFSWSGDRSQYDKPAAPRRFVSGELNTVGYNWVSLPYSRTGLWYTQGYFDWCAETLASMGQSAPSAGYGLLVGEDSEF